jgi:hypothetical protein
VILGIIEVVAGILGLMAVGFYLGMKFSMWAAVREVWITKDPVTGREKT